MRGWRLGGAGPRCYPGSNNTRQGYALRSTLKPAGYFFCVEVESASGKRYIDDNTPAMPLTEAHFGGFFVSGHFSSVAMADSHAILSTTTPLTPLNDAHQEGLLFSGAGK